MDFRGKRFNVVNCVFVCVCVCVCVCARHVVKIVLFNCKRSNIDNKCVPVLIIVTDFYLLNLKTSFVAQLFISSSLGAVCPSSFASLQIVQPFWMFTKFRMVWCKILMKERRKRKLYKKIFLFFLFQTGRNVHTELQFCTVLNRL